MNYREKECPMCYGERWIELNDEYGTSIKCELCKGTGIVGYTEEIINGEIVIKPLNEK